MKVIDNILKILGVVDTTKEDKREEKRRRKRSMRPEALQIPGRANNRAVRRLALKNKIPVELLMAMQRGGLIDPKERRIDKSKIEAFVAAVKAGRRLRETYGLKDDPK